MYLELVTIFLHFIISTSKIDLEFSLLQKTTDSKELDLKKVERYLVSIHEYNNISKRYKHICSGTILTEVWILTSANCVFDQKHELKPPNLLSISHLTTFHGVLVPVEKIVTSTAVSTCDGHSNLALLQTSISLDVGVGSGDDATNQVVDREGEASIIPEKQLFMNATPDEVFTGTCYAVSWVLWGEKITGALSYKIKKWPVHLMTHDMCRTKWNNISDNTICTIDINRTYNIPWRKINMITKCQMDPGAVLICNNMQLAILSTHFCNTSLPILWTRLDTHRKCLQTTISSSKYPGKLRASKDPLHEHPRRSFHLNAPSNGPDDSPVEAERKIKKSRSGFYYYVPRLVRRYPEDAEEAVPVNVKYSGSEEDSYPEERGIVVRPRRTTIIRRRRPSPILIVGVIVAVLVVVGVIIFIVLCICCSFLFAASACCADCECCDCCDNDN